MKDRATHANPAYVATLEQLCAEPRQVGFGSTVLCCELPAETELESLARQSYQTYPGEVLERCGEAMFAARREVWRRQPDAHGPARECDIIQALQKADYSTFNSRWSRHGMPSEKAQAARPTPSRAFDLPEVADLRFCHSGDTETYSRLFITGSCRNHEATALILLLD